MLKFLKHRSGNPHIVVDTARATWKIKDLNAYIRSPGVQRQVEAVERLAKDLGLKEDWPL